MSKARPNAASLLTSLDDLFTTQAEQDETKLEPVLEIPLDQISPFPGHPFKVKADGTWRPSRTAYGSTACLCPRWCGP